jgi:hypothetical protein
VLELKSATLNPDICGDDMILSSSLDQEFPIKTQSSIADRVGLLALRNNLCKGSTYRYVEIGSYLGGSLTPFLRDQRCIKVLSIDGAKYDYSGITHDTMIRNLVSHNLEVEKLEVFDGSVSEYKKSEVLFDFLFIDGEHTNWACFRDFIYGRKILQKNSIVAFHDSDLIFGSLKIIQEYLVSQNVKFEFIKIRGSNLSFICLNDYVDLRWKEEFEIETDIDLYYSKCEDVLLLENVRNRLTFNFSLKGIGFALKPKASHKQNAA